MTGAPADAPLCPAQTAPSENNAQFTVDGSPALERRISSLCAEVRGAVLDVVPAPKIDGLVLAGGYGRGEGGVLLVPDGDAPYNDLEFYLFLTGDRLWNQRRYAPALDLHCHRLSGLAALHVEIKIDSLAQWQRQPVSMFSYDVAARHRIVHGLANLFQDLPHHLRAEEIPLAEATRLLFNRCGGLLLSLELLRARNFSPAEADFVARNLAKAQLALGDVALVAAGQYHWSCRERHLRLLRLDPPAGFPRIAEIQAHHAQGVQFKLHPVRSTATPDQLTPRFRAVSALARQIWFWLESRRLGISVTDALAYAAYPGVACANGPSLSHWLQNVRTFGLVAGSRHLACRYPRERLMRALVLLLWEPDLCETNPRRTQLQSLLGTRAATWPEFVQAYKNLWPPFG